MKIEGNQKELDAMVEFHKGNRVEGLRLHLHMADGHWDAESMAGRRNM